MKRILCLIVCVIGGLFNLGAQEHKHAIEISTGCPSIVTMFEAIRLNSEIHDKGQCYGNDFQPVLNIGYTYSWHNRWELSALLDCHLTVIDINQYPSVIENNEVKYDFKAEPALYGREVCPGGSLSASVRYKWLAKENVTLYSALGLGFHFAFTPLIPLPYIAPLGIKFGKGKVYGLVEANVSPATSFCMLGLGIRL